MTRGSVAGAFGFARERERPGGTAWAGLRGGG